MPPAYRVEYDPEAEDDLEYYRGRGSARVLGAVKQQLQYEPLRRTRNRKPLDPNPLAAWELRVVPFRVLYDVNEERRVVYVRAVVYKERAKTYRQGQEVSLRERSEEQTE